MRDVSEKKLCDAKIRLWPLLVTNRQHCRWKSRKKHFTLRSVSKKNSQSCSKQTPKKILLKKFQCEDDACDHLWWPTDNTVDGKVVKSITHFGVLQNRIHEVARSILRERCQRYKTCDAKIRLRPLLVTNRQHCRWKSGKKHYTLRSFAKQNSRSC